VPLGAASSFDPTVAATDHRFGARESAAVGIKQIYSPMVDVSHDPRWGRIAEAGGEDPYLNSVFAAARVRAAQGGDYSAPDTVVTSVKHYAAYGQPEGGRDYNTTDMSEQRLRNLYLPPFKAAIDAGSDTVMCSFNAVNGVPGCANHYTETDILKDEWGWRGFVMSDFFAGAYDGKKAALAGLDLEMPMTQVYGRKLQDAVEKGEVPVAVVDDAVRRILRRKLEYAARPDPIAYPAALVRAPEHVALAREAAEKGIVLLKNDAALPLDPAAVKSVAVVGRLADSLGAL